MGIQKAILAVAVPLIGTLLTYLGIEIGSEVITGVLTAVLTGAGVYAVTNK